MQLHRPHLWIVTFWPAYSSQSIFVYARVVRMFSFDACRHFPNEATSKYEMGTVMRGRSFESHVSIRNRDKARRITSNIFVMQIIQLL